MDEITHSFLHLEPEGTLGRFFCPLNFCSLVGGQMKFKYRDGGPHITRSREGRRGERGTTQEGGASCAQPWLLLALLFKHHQETHTSCHT